MGYVDWHEEPGYWRDVTRHFPRDARLLDVGCGGAWIGDHFDDYTGIDVSPEAVEAARSRGRQVLLVDGDEPLPFDEESFDGVVLKDVLEHVANPVALVREVRRVLRPGGRVFASSPGRAALGLGRLHPPPPLHAEELPQALRGPGPAGGAAGLRVGHARQRDRFRLDQAQPETTPARGARAPADGAPQRLACGQSLSRQPLERFATIRSSSACRGLRIEA